MFSFLLASAALARGSVGIRQRPGYASRGERRRRAKPDEEAQDTMGLSPWSFTQFCLPSLKWKHVDGVFEGLENNKKREF